MLRLKVELRFIFFKAHKNILGTIIIIKRNLKKLVDFIV